MNADGTQQINLTNNPASDGEPDWSPDGTHIVFSSDRCCDGQDELFMMGADGSQPTQLTLMAADQVMSPAWSPDGTQIVFEAGSVVNHDIYVMTFGSPVVTDLTNNPGYDEYPSWQP
jgi:Tol biopolymer transport system component